MSLNVKGQSCPICHAYLFEEDDIVYCPTCGAPHHKDCFLTIGHCGLEDFHGTDKQYDRTKSQSSASDETQENTQTENTVPKMICPRCHAEYSPSENHCPSCGLPNIAFGKNAVMLDPLGGVPADYDIGGIKAKQAAKFVGASTMRIIPKFARMFAGEKTFFSVWALLFPGAYFAFRKMWKCAAVTTVIEIVSTLISIPFMNFVASLNTDEIANYTELVSNIYANIGNIGKGVLILYALGAVINLVLRFVSGFTADKLYYKHTLETVKDIEENSDDKEEAYAKKGGVSLIGFIAFIIITEYLPELIFMFIG